MEMQFWHWWIVGVGLIAAEMAIPGAYLLFPGIAALITGFLAWLMPGAGWEVHALSFAVLTVASAALGLRLYRRFTLGEAKDHPGLNKRGSQMVGTIHTLDTPILDGFGRMKVGDSTWKIAGPDLPVGTKVRVVAVDGIVLRVEAVE